MSKRGLAVIVLSTLILASITAAYFPSQVDATVTVNISDFAFDPNVADDKWTLER